MWWWCFDVKNTFTIFHIFNIIIGYIIRWLSGLAVDKVLWKKKEELSQWRKPCLSKQDISATSVKFNLSFRYTAWLKDIVLNTWQSAVFFLVNLIYLFSSRNSFQVFFPSKLFQMHIKKFLLKWITCIQRNICTILCKFSIFCLWCFFFFHFLIVL